MAFRNGSYAKVWKINTGKGNYTDVQLSTSKKNQQTDQYETDFSSYVRFIGDAHKNAGSLTEGCRIKIGDCSVTNSYSKEKNTTYTNYQVYTFELADGNNGSQGLNMKPKDTSFMDIPDNIEEELPFN